VTNIEVEVRAALSKSGCYHSIYSQPWIRKTST
jgi:hypothetical protein